MTYTTYDKYSSNYQIFNLTHVGNTMQINRNFILAYMKSDLIPSIYPYLAVWKIEDGFRGQCTLSIINSHCVLSLK